MKKALFNKLLSGIISLGVFTNFNFTSKRCFANDEAVGEYDLEPGENFELEEDEKEQSSKLSPLKIVMSCLVSPMLPELTAGNTLAGLISPASFIPFRYFMSWLERDKLVRNTFLLKNKYFRDRKDPIVFSLTEEEKQNQEILCKLGEYLEGNPNIAFSTVLKEGIKNQLNSVVVSADDVKKAWNALSMWLLNKGEPYCVSSYAAALPAFIVSWYLHNFAFTACSTVADVING